MSFLRPNANFAKTYALCGFRGGYLRDLNTLGYIIRSMRAFSGHPNPNALFYWTIKLVYIAQASALCASALKAPTCERQYTARGLLTALAFFPKASL